MPQASRSPYQDFVAEAKSSWWINGSLPLSNPHARPTAHASNFLRKLCNGVRPVSRLIWQPHRLREQRLPET
jgi:hypothetical protein